MKGRGILAITTVAISLSVPAAENLTRVNVLDFRSRVVDLGKDTEDWQPAFQSAIEKAFATSRVVYVPAGRYPIYKCITIWAEPTGAFISSTLSLVGDSRFVTTIQQKSPDENVIDWTGHKYEESLSAGTMEKLCLAGGKIGLNMKWHNQFTMRACYVVGASEAGIHAEGWSNRFLDILVRHCYNIGFKGRAHFNDITIRDGYFSRCGVGLWLVSAHGVRVDGIGFEHCANTAIYTRASTAVSIVSCYFEGDGMGNKRVVPGWGFPSSIAIDDRNLSVLIQGCIFRGTARGAGHVRLAGCENGAIRNNLFQIHYDEAGVMLANASYKDYPFRAKSVIVENNNFCWASRKRKAMGTTPVPLWYTQTQEGLLSRALSNGCRFDGHEGRTQVLTDPAKARPAGHDAEGFE